MKKTSCKRGFTQIIKVILNLIQDLRRLLLSSLNSVRGRYPAGRPLKYGMTSLFNNGGFTLIELLVVVLIIGILAAVAVPQYKKAVIRSRVAKQIALLSDIYPAVESCFLETGNISQCTKEKLALDFDTTCPSLGSPYRDDCSVSWKYQTYDGVSDYQPAIAVYIRNNVTRGSASIVKFKDELGCLEEGMGLSSCKLFGFSKTCKNVYRGSLGGVGGFNSPLCR